MDRDEAILTATPATFLDKKSKATSLLEALKSPPEYPLSKALTVEQARVILDVAHRRQPNFLRADDQRRRNASDKLVGWIYYYVSDPKHGELRWALKNKEIQLQIRRSGRWANAVMGGATLIIEAALVVLEAVAKRRKDDVLANAVAGWRTTREIAAERGQSERDQKEFTEKLKAMARHEAVVKDPTTALELASLYLRKKLDVDPDVQLLSKGLAKFQGAVANEQARLAKRYFTLAQTEDWSPPYTLDQPPVLIAAPTYNFVIGERPDPITQFTRGGFEIYEAGNQDTKVELFSNISGKIEPIIVASTEMTPAMVSVLTRVLRGYGLDWITVSTRAFAAGDALEAAGYVFRDGAYRAPRANPRRRRARR